jgi:hypothetical protein
MQYIVLNVEGLEERDADSQDVMKFNIVLAI